MSFLDLNNRISVVTGAGRGIGAAISRELAGVGSSVALLDLDEGNAKKTAEALAHDFPKLSFRAYGVDMRDFKAIAATIARVAADFGAIDHLVNNAGVQFVSPIADFPEDKWELVTSTDLDSVFYASKSAWPHLAARKRGRIVNIASVQGLIGTEYKAAYVAAKHGVVGLTKVSAIEGAPHGITVNAICPGVVMTDLIRGQAPGLMKSYGGGISEEEALRRAFLARMPTERFIEPIEVAQLATYLCSDAARSITGAAIAIDGGWSAQ